MNKQLQALTNYLLEISLRERVLLLFIVIALLYALWDGLIYSSQLTYHKQLVEQEEQLNNENLTQQLEQAESIVLLKKQATSKADLQHQIETAKNQLTDSETALNTVLEGLVPPTKITELLHSLFLQTHGLKLIALNNEPVEVITVNENKTAPVEVKDGEKPDTEHSILYKHSTTMVLSGNFQQLYEYLKMIEQSKWSLYWDKLEYHVQTYPNAKITLRVHTISADQYWIGL